MSVRESIDPKSSLWAWMAFDLWFYRSRRGLSLAQVAMIVNATRGTVSNWEAGRFRPSDTCMKRLDQAWDTGGHFERLHMFACAGHDPDWFRQYVQYEMDAEIIKMFHGKNVPLLVQTEAYAQGVLRAAGHMHEAEATTKARMKRQEILTRDDPPYLWILIDQEVLDCPVAGSEVMRGQLARLLEVAELPHVCVRVVLRESGWHPGHDGPFQVLRIRGREVAYAGAQIGGRLIEAGDQADTLTIRFDQIGANALSRAASKDLIERTMRTYE
ncbi:helix-turn-helix domain-containing protein [Actinomadura latina]|uniref:Helix-turn-helix transcriptional regulator n=1 Tax=Actinomadura latina TaxID=163603 RepID=A0A846YUS1_9ACTN|nr:helix-turn-helix transcriptional regulator [Actinomadura latina]NKZ03851.1 helix-turn-helix transcriptional regulator [Actinomadura latina]